jgi:hypothetical protein
MNLSTNYPPLAKLATIVTIIFMTLSSCARANSLIVGPDGQSQQVDISLNLPSELNYKTKAEILQMRSDIVNRSSSLLAEPYVASKEVFDAIEDRRPWWGMHGGFIWGAGNRSIEGDAEESRFLLNPLLLVGANSGSAYIWDTEKITNADLSDKSFPYCWMPQSLRWFPKDALVQVTYDVTNYNRELANRKDKLQIPDLQILKFSLIPYNARDFGFHYIYLDVDKSMNIDVQAQSEGPSEIHQMIHCGGSCQYPGGCNNMSPTETEHGEFNCRELPARANVLLWKNKPGSKDAKPDLTIFMDMR